VAEVRGVNVEVSVRTRVAVGSTGVCVAVGVAELVGIGVAVWDGVAVAVRRAVAVSVPVGESLGVVVGEGVRGVGVEVLVEVSVGRAV